MNSLPINSISYDDAEMEQIQQLKNYFGRGHVDFDKPFGKIGFSSYDISVIVTPSMATVIQKQFWARNLWCF